MKYENPNFRFILDNGQLKLNKKIMFSNLFTFYRENSANFFVKIVFRQNKKDSNNLICIPSGKSHTRLEVKYFDPIISLTRPLNFLKVIKVLITYG